MSSLHEQDFYSWTQEQAAGLRRLAQLRRNDLPVLDWEQLAEEVEDLGKSLERELGSRFVVLLLHLLKWRYQPGFRSVSWQLSLTGQRRRLARLLRKNPGLKSKSAEEFAEAYESARLRAASETGLDVDNFPPSCPFTLEQAMDDGFWPDEERC
jgi:hypothetical protein